MVSRSRVAFSNNWARSCFRRIVFVRGEKCSMSSMITRRKDEDDTIRQDGFTMASRRARWTHELNTKTHLREPFREFFDMPKILRRSRSCCRSLRKFTGDHTMAYDALTHGAMFSRSEPNVKICHRVSILCQLRDSVTQAYMKTQHIKFEILDQRLTL